MLDLGHRAERIVHHGQLMAASANAQALPNENDAWQPPIIQTVATNNSGIPELAAQIDAHRTYLQESGTLAQREQSRLDIEITERLRQALLTRLIKGIGPTTIRDVIDKVSARQLDPDSAVQLLLEQSKIVP